MSVKIYIRDNINGNIHEYGTNQHDALILQEDGSLHYRNLQNGCGTMFPDEGYTFCEADGSAPRTRENYIQYGVEPYIDIGGNGEDHTCVTCEWISVKDRLPESGVHVLLCCEMHRRGGEIAGKYVCDGYYAEANKIIAGGFPDECDCEYSEEDDEHYLREGWYEVIKNWDDYNSVTVGDFVTHWMPLPDPPETLIKEG